MTTRRDRPTPSAIRGPSSASGEPDTIIPIAGSTGDLAGGVKTPSLRGLTAAGPPYFHDGRAASLGEAVQLMNGQVGGTLSAAEQAAVVEYLKSL
jgi:cytochrome c peroxidase